MSTTKKPKQATNNLQMQNDNVYRGLSQYNMIILNKDTCKYIMNHKLSICCAVQLFIYYTKHLGHSKWDYVDSQL